MTQEEKQLLLKDLCARLPYHPVIRIYNDSWEGCQIGEFDNKWEGYQLVEFDNNMYFHHLEAFLCSRIEITPYLRPMSSMTKEERDEWMKITHAQEWLIIGNLDKATDWLNEHHFDYRGLIEKGLALEALEGMYKTE